MTPNPVSHQEKWKKALLQAGLGLFVVVFLSLVIFRFEPPNWLTGLICLGNILWFSALPIILVALLANAPFPDRAQAAQIKEPTKIEDLLAEEYWPVERQEPQRKIEEPAIPNNNTSTWMILFLAAIMLIMITLVFILLSTSPS